MYVVFLIPLHLNHASIKLRRQVRQQVNSGGLSDQQVAQSRERHGENVLTPPKKTPLWRLYLEKYDDPMIRILLVAAFISLILAVIKDDYLETVGIFLAVFFATTVGFYFERDAARKFDVLTAIGEESPVKVVRNGKVCQIPRRAVVVGDVVVLAVGDEVPADGVLTEATDLQIDESALTGEPIASKFVEARNDGAAYPSNQVLRSTMVMNGSGRMTVTAVGDATEIGKVARQSTEMTSVKTPLNIQLDRLAKMISKVGMTVSTLAFFSFLIHDMFASDFWQHDYLRMAESVLRYFMLSVTLIVMSVPEGLPMAVTLALALNMRRMLKSNNLVRKFHACETMGAVTVICTDKTGTLTQNKMRVGELVANDDIDNAIALNSTADIDADKAVGNPTEAALLLYMREKMGRDYRAIRQKSNIVWQLPFSTENKFMATVALSDGNRILYTKGAPEIVVAFCQLGEEERDDIMTRLSAYQHKAMRTLAFARLPLDGLSTDNYPKLLADIRSGKVRLRYQGIASISDPLREEVPVAVRQCRDAGIEVKMVTGDTSATAIEIARQIGIWDDATPSDAHITGSEFAALSDEEAYRRTGVLRVMSRARPTDKQRLVSLLQKRGEVVAVTGDGTNDAPALHHAHVGLSLGSGTSVAKNASDMTLIDDSFGSIVKAVQWGRSLYKNIQRFIYFQLVVNVAALTLVFGGSLIGTELPLTITQVLWINLIMDTFAAMALATLPPEGDVMREKPRSQADFIITRGMAKAILSTGLAFFAIMLALLWYFERKAGVSIEELTIFFTVFVMLQWWNLFNAKTLGTCHSAFRHFLADKGLMVVMLTIIAGQWLIVMIGGRMFRTVPLSLPTWIVIIVGTSPVMIIGEIVRAIGRARVKRSGS